MKKKERLWVIAATLLLMAQGSWAQDATAYAVTALGEEAFLQSTLTSVQLPKQTLRVIGSYAFCENRGLTTVDIPEGVTTIGTAAFAAYDLTHLHIPASITKMGSNAVGECPTLESVTVAEGNTQFGVFDGVLMDKAQTRLICYPAKMAGKTYKATPVWKNFNVQPLAGTGISISEELRVKSEEFATAPGWYSLDGRRLDGKPAQPGIYVNGGRKVVIK